VILVTNEELILQEIRKINGRLDTIENDVSDVRREIVKTTIVIENKITKRLDSLFEGYSLNREKQEALEIEVEDLKARVDRLEVITA
jgi:polyhydroxyalkanoate synthesis regulator phasin